jgi:hypothetical protein
MWLAEKAAASAMLRPLSLVVCHGARLMSSPICLPRSPSMEQPAHIEDISWQAMLAKGECEASEDEIAVLEAEHGPVELRSDRG